MDPDVILRIVQLMLLCASAFFSSSEVAPFSLSKMDLNNLRRAKHPQTANLYRLRDQPRRLIISILCGNELVNIAAAANMAAILLSLVKESQAGHDQHADHGADAAAVRIPRLPKRSSSPVPEVTSAFPFTRRK